MQCASHRSQLGGFALPDFIIIGAAKCATTSLLYYIGKHAEVRLGWKKATHYFDLHTERDLSWYARQFPRVGLLSRLRGGGASPRWWLTGESCPSYMFLEEVPERALRCLPQVKIIAVLRDPVKRLVSHYRHERRKDRIAPGFSAYVEESIDLSWPPPRPNMEIVRQRLAVPRGFYEDQLRHWMRFFPRDRFCVVRFEDLVSESATTMARIFQFLALPDQRVDTSRVLNRATGMDTEPIDPQLLQRLRDLYRDRNRGLEALIGEGFSYWTGT